MIFSIQYDKELEQLEHDINPLLGDDPQASLSFLFRKCIEKMATVPNVRKLFYKNFIIYH